MPLNGSYDLAITGSGFGGSLLAMIARRCGLSVVLLEKGTHPRFAIGESTTPLANLLLEEIADRYGLPRLKPFSKWGTWQQSYPEVACGLKRGFTFYHHTPGAEGTAPTREQQLLVAASPDDRTSDTHWYRAEFDHFFVREAQAMGADYFDHVTLTGFEESESGITIIGEQVSIRTRFLVDASGPRGFVHRTLGLAEETFPDYPPTTALYSHFSGVDWFDRQPSAPYPPDDAALHHVFEGGWIWVLRFNNGLTSAGVAATDAFASGLKIEKAAAAWDRLLKLLPAVGGQFAGAKAELPFVQARRLSFLSSCTSGHRWAMLPSAAGFIDPLLSTGFALTLFGVARLGEILAEGWDGDRIAAYAAQTRRELLATARLIGALYASMNNFPLFTSLTFLYFAAASFSEAARRLDKHELASSFLLCDDPVFGPASARCCAQALQVRTPEDSARLSAEILRTIEPFNVAGLGDPARRNWFPVSPEDLIRGSSKLGAAQREIARLLDRSGFQDSV